MTTTNCCCAECGADGGASLKVCKSCMHARYCSSECQKNHWPKHKKLCKQRAAELRDEALFKDPPPKEDCPICFLPMPHQLICCASLPPATLSSIPIYDYATANEELANEPMEQYYSCCGKEICKGCVHSFRESGNTRKCPFCNADCGKSEEEEVQEMMRRVDANDAASICVMAGSYYQGLNGFQQDRTRAIELFTKGNMKKAKFHVEAAAMAGDEVARFNVGSLEANSGNVKRAMKHWTIGASAGGYKAMHHLRLCFEKGYVSRESIDSTLAAYNSSCAEMRSEARDSYIHMWILTL